MIPKLVALKCVPQKSSKLLHSEAFKGYFPVCLLAHSALYFRETLNTRTHYGLLFITVTLPEVCCYLGFDNTVLMYNSELN